MLALAVDGLRSNERSIDLDPEETARCNSLVWYGCANRLIQLGNGVGRAQVRFIMFVSDVTLPSACPGLY